MEQVAVRRLLLSKEFFRHAFDRSEMAGALNKMIAVHNFHIAIEIALRTIMLYHRVRTEKTLNIDFETMLSEIDNHPIFKQSGKKLPYRQELRNLNNLRNLVQHQAVEPESGTMEEWRVFTLRFLKRAFDEYFSLDFDRVSRISFVDDGLLRAMLEKSQEDLKQGDRTSALRMSAAAFEYASQSIWNLLPSEGFNSAFFVSSSLRFSGSERHLIEALERTYARIRKSEHLSAILASGVSLASVKRFEALTPAVQMSIGGGLYFQGGGEHTTEEAAWVHDFVVDSIISWQGQGLNPEVPEFGREAASRLVDGMDDVGRAPAAPEG